MSHAQSCIAPSTGSRKRSDGVLLAAGVLFAVLLVIELALVLTAAPALDPLAPFYVT
jgi:hypothetical protein